MEVDDIEDIEFDAGHYRPPARADSGVARHARAPKSHALSSNGAAVTDGAGDEQPCASASCGGGPAAFRPGLASVWVKTFGCAHNTSDSEYMMGQLADYGYRCWNTWQPLWACLPPKQMHCISGVCGRMTHHAHHASMLCACSRAALACFHVSSRQHHATRA